jgi:hypothetical protein
MVLPLSSTVDRPVTARKKDPLKSRVGNGSALLCGVDQRSTWVRRLKETLADHLSDIPDASAAERSIIRRSAVLTIELERLETKFATVGAASDGDLDLYQRTASSLRRLLEAVGLKRQARLVGPSFGDLLRQDAIRQSREDAALTVAKREAFEQQQSKP